MPSNELTKGFDPASIVGPEPESVKNFLSLLVEGKTARAAALGAGISESLANALLAQPDFVGGLEMAITRRLQTALVPKAMRAASNLLDDAEERLLKGLPPVAEGVQARVALELMRHAHAVKESESGGGNGQIGRMSAAQLEARLAQLRAEEHTLDAQFVPVSTKDGP